MTTKKKKRTEKNKKSNKTETPKKQFLFEWLFIVTQTITHHYKKKYLNLYIHTIPS